MIKYVLKVWGGGGEVMGVVLIVLTYILRK